MKSFHPARALLSLCLLGRNVFTASAVDLDPAQPASVRQAAKDVASGLMSLYATPGAVPNDMKVISGIPGLLTYPPYYWWEAGAMLGQMIDYWYYTNDSTYNDLVKEGILHQIGEQANLMPSNQSKDEGNDDQLFWAFTVMSAAELGFPDPPAGQPGWLALAQSVMNQLIARWNLENNVCGGGLRWQIYQWITGYTYKNTAANGGMFQLGARLARYTGNETYAEYALKAYDWLAKSPLITKDFQVNDGTDLLKGCTDADQTQWTYNYGIMIGGAAYMYNYTNGSDVWAQRLSGFLKHTGFFFPQDKGSVMVEICEETQRCNIDQWSFKAYLSRWLAVAAQLAPFTYPQIAPILAHSGQAAAKTCTGGPQKNQCGSRWWWKDGFDGNTGVGQQMSALSIISSNLISQVRGPFTNASGGTSQGNPSAGTGGDKPPELYYVEVTTADKAGAGILTAIVLGVMVSGGWWLMA